MALFDTPHFVTNLEDVVTFSGSRDIEHAPLWQFITFRPLLATINHVYHMRTVQR